MLPGDAAIRRDPAAQAYAAAVQAVELPGVLLVPRGHARQVERPAEAAKEAAPHWVHEAALIADDTKPAGQPRQRFAPEVWLTSAYVPGLQSDGQLVLPGAVAAGQGVHAVWPVLRRNVPLGHDRHVVIPAKGL